MIEVIMIRTIQCLLPLDPSLIETIRVYNQAVQVVIDAGWELRVYNKNVLHAVTYIAVRDMVFPGLSTKR